MRIRDVNFPEALLSAQKEDNLVIFAGAGVSMPPPSNYPDFPGLASTVASGVLIQREEEPTDRFLGRLRDQGIMVHALVKEILTNPGSEPNSLHVDLLKLFRSAETLRLVTTNFDLHFSQAASIVFDSPPSCETYSAPALPLGDSFNGIVYLHSSVDKSPERLVLTDRDFGRAYLTEGWARIFLQRLFTRYTVLFVGYSHSDVVMNYLARGLPPQSGVPQRFALTPVGNEEHWKSLGITPVVYPLIEDPNKHSRLAEAIGGWAAQARQGALDQEQRIRSIVGLPPSLDPEATDYIEACFAQVDTARFFTRHANTSDWLEWIDDKKLLARLFQTDSSLTDVDTELANWIGVKFVVQHADEVLWLVQRHGHGLNPAFWSIITSWLFRKEPGKRNDPMVLQRWIPILISLWSPQCRLDYMDFLLADMKGPEDCRTAVILFEFMTRPILRLEKNWWRDDADNQERVSAEITTLGNDHWLKHLWQKFLSVNLSTLADNLEPIVTSHLNTAHLLLSTQQKAGDNFDPLSHSRGQIENSQQGDVRSGIAVLIDLGYELIRFNNSERPLRADGIIAQWFASASLLLKRLAIIGVAENEHWMPDQKLSWLLGEDLLYRYGFKHEVFEVLKAAYAGSSDEVKKAIIHAAKVGRVPGFEISEEIMLYERYNLLNWLQSVAPDSQLTKQEFETMQEAHKGFRQRGRPDLDVEFSGPTFAIPGYRRPVSVEWLLGKSPAEQVDWLVSFKPQHPLDDRYGIVEAVREAASQKFEWGMGLAGELAARNIWDSDLWPAIVNSWNSNSQISQWTAAFELVMANQKMLPITERELATLLYERTKESSPSIPQEALALATEVSKVLWAVCAAEDDPRKGKPNDDWLFTAINHPAGILAQFWLNCLSKRRKDSADRWSGIEKETGNFLRTVLANDSYAADLVRVVFAAQLNFLFAIDEEWTKKCVLPLFDWSTSNDIATQVFQGFLFWGRQTEALIPYLLPLYVKAFPHMAALGKARNRFCEYLAGLACFSSINPLENGWINQFLLKSELPDRIAFAASVRQMLRGMQNEPRKTLWDVWIGKYWRNRLHGLPIPFDSAELGVMVEWTLFLGPAFPSAVRCIQKSPAFRLEHSFIYRELEESNIPSEHPSKTAELLVVLLRNEVAVLFDLDRVDAIVRRITGLGPSLPDLLAICDHLARLGYADAGNLRQFVTSHQP
ncbi:MAG TPA: DUF4020 domain-containing protein [Candidatus Acidoferrales bacterium]|nr:DUF4020 domain-containing protein [Candidatus Acidoferrales bacterium]